MGGGLQFAYVIIRGVRNLLIFADKGGRVVENCKKHAYVIFEQALLLSVTVIQIFSSKKVYMLFYFFINPVILKYIQQI